MRRFKFTLESVLTLRQKALEDARIQLAKILNVLNMQEDILRQMQEQYIQISNEREKCLSGSEFNPDEISNYNAFLNKLSQDIKTQELIIQKTKEDLAIQQEITKEAYIKVKSLEKLKEKQKEEYNKLAQLEEFKLIDDIVNSKRAAV